VAPTPGICSAETLARFVLFLARPMNAKRKIFLDKRISALLFTALLVTACGHGGNGAAQPANLPVPTDEATPEQRAAIDATLSRIEGVTAELGHPHRFRAIPILVTTDNKYITDAKGACVKVGTRPQFILVRPSVLKFELDQAPDSPTTSLFPVLLHEIGHCYFAREHDPALIRTDGSLISMTRADGSVAQPFEALEASVMHPEKTQMYVEFEHYYAAEVMGLVPNRTLEAFGRYDARASFHFVKKTPIDQGTNPQPAKPESRID
jgi:hypothetical protein